MARTIRRVAGTGAAMVFAFALLAISSMPAAAEDSGVYIAANYGTAPRLFQHSELDAALVAAFNETLTLESTSVKKEHATWSAGVGYRMGQNFAVEVTYLDLEKIHYDATGSVLASGTSYASHLELDTKSRGAALALVWGLPLWNDWGVDARAGAYRGMTSTAFTSTIGEKVTPQSLSEKSTSLLLGVGASYVATEHLIVRIDYLHLNDIKEKAFNAGFDADVATVGLTYAF